MDTNVIIHLYRSGKKQILFQRFADGIYIYEQIRYVELENHGQDILEELDGDIADGKIILITNEWLKDQGVLSLFNRRVQEHRLLYNSGDLGEVYAISAAEILGAYSLITDDIKQGGPYMSLLQFDDNEIMPFTVVDVLLLNYLEGKTDAQETLDMFEATNSGAELNWNFRSHYIKFIKRFWREPYQEKEREWMKKFCGKYKIKAKERLDELRKLL